MVRNSQVAKLTASKRLLIVDDEPFNLKTMGILLEMSFKQLNFPPELLGLILDKAKDGNEAIALVKSAHLN